MTRLQTLLTSLALAAPLVLGAGIGFAQQSPQSRPGQTAGACRASDGFNAMPDGSLACKVGVPKNFVYFGMQPTRSQVAQR